MTLYRACERIIAEADVRCDCDIETVFGGLSGAAYTTAVNNLLDAACDALANVSGYPVGRCTKIYRPCRDRCHYYECSCGCNLTGIRLPGLDPVVNSVTIDGVTLGASEWTVLLDSGGFYYLERIGTDGVSRQWPSTQHLRRPTSGESTFSVSVTAGTWTDQIAKNAAAEIACDMLTYMATEREAAPDGVIAAQVYGVSLDWRRFSAPTEQETMRIAGMSWVQRFISTRGSNHPVGISSPGLDHGWSLYEVLQAAA